MTPKSSLESEILDPVTPSRPALDLRSPNAYQFGDPFS